MPMTQLELINASLVKLGAYKITSLSDGSTEADIAGALYGPVRDGALSAYPWGFAGVQTTLSTPVAAPIADYTYAFTLPADHLRTLSVGGGGSGSGARFRHNGSTIETDESSVVLTYIRRVDESVQPPYFNLVLIARLAAEFCLPLTENAARAEALYRLAEQEFVRARALDAQQDSPASLRRFNLIDARG